jgi:YHS domain-containing protein
MLLRFVLLSILLTIVARTFWRLVDGIVEGLSGKSSRSRVSQRGLPMERDPVCGTFVLPDRALVLADGRARYFFCSEACRDAFRARTA